MDRDLGFGWRTRKNGEVELLRGGRIVTLLRGDKATAFLGSLARLDEADAQHLMARLTGNYKRGNERLSDSPSQRR
ncbi:hypothetical protein [Niveibacterium terrae]|uniref:hypothetical protein n=1 Tax=Niveibacterium terrae TaxID=3373598 RepID=UPI003A8CAB24